MTVSLTGILFMAVGICGFIALILYHARRLRWYREAAKFPGPPGLPVIGSALYFFGGVEDILNKAFRLLDSYPSPFKVWVAGRLYFGVYEPEHVKTILLSPNAIEKDDVYRFGRPWGGTGLLLAPADKWRIHRKLIQPTFNKKILESFVEIFAKQSNILTEQLRKELGKGEFDVFKYVSLCTLDMICESAMGVPVGAQTGNNNRYIDAARRQIEIVYLRMYKIWLQYDFIFNLTKFGEDQRSCLKYLHGVTDDVIEKKKSVYDNNDQSDNLIWTPERATTKKVFLDLLMELSKEGVKLTDGELRDEVNTMMIAGNDTTASVNTFVLMMFAIFPEVQQKVYEELCKIYGDEISSDTPITYEDLNRMEYMERVIKETLRLFPPGALLARHLTDDVKIDDQRILPKGSSVILGIMKLHRWEKFWPDPLKFDPDRFLPDEVAKRHPYCHVPFSGGPRNCIGQKFAMMSMKTLLASVLRCYVIRTNKRVKIEDIKLSADFLMKPVESVTVEIFERKIKANIREYL